MSETSPTLALPYLMPSQAQKHVTHNEALRLLDALVQLTVEDFGSETPPLSPQEGEAHVLGAAPTDGWAGQAGRLAVWQDSAWHFLEPQEGWRAYGRTSGELRIRTAAGWSLAGAETQNLERLGVGTAADAANPLSVSARAALFSHAGSGHQVKINKAAGTDTAALLFQSGWTGHAEAGLLGSNDFALKVSDDGSSWR